MPSVRLLDWTGLVQVVKLELSILQSKLLIPTPVSLPENSNVAMFEDVFSPEVIIDLLPSVADRIELSGGTVSIVQLNDAGDGSLFDELSSDNTLKV